MASGPHLERRGAVYYWRRRLPPAFARIVSRTHLRMSLGTKEPALARRLAARLDATASELFAERGGGDMMDISGVQLEALFADVLNAHKTKLAKLADLNRCDGTLGDPREEMRQERAMGWAYRILARNGVAARIYDHDRETMRQAGLDETAIARVAATLDWMHASDMARPSTWRLGEALKAVGAEMTSANVARGQSVYLRALGEALLQTEERHMRDPIDFARLMEETGQTVSGTTTGALSPPIEKVRKPRSISESDPVEQAGPPAINTGIGLGVIDRSAVPASPMDGKSSLESAKDEAAKPRSARPRGRPPSDQLKTKAPPLGSPREIGAKLIAAKVADQRWDTKTAQQAGVTFDLFTRC